MLLVTIPTYLVFSFIVLMAIIWFIYYTIDRRRKDPNYKWPISFHDNEYADDRFLGI